MSDKFADIAAEHLEIVLVPGMLARATFNTKDKELAAWQDQLEMIYRAYIDPGYDGRCPHCFNNMVRYFRRKREIKIQREQAWRKQAEKIAAEDRREILALGLIEEATPHLTSKSMYYLAVAWRRSINPHFRADCETCLTFVLREFEAMLPYLQELERGPDDLLNLIP